MVGHPKLCVGKKMKHKIDNFSCVHYIPHVHLTPAKFSTAPVACSVLAVQYTCNGFDVLKDGGAGVRSTELAGCGIVMCVSLLYMLLERGLRAVSGGML